MPSPLIAATAVTRHYLALILAVLLAAGTLAVLAAAPARAAVDTTIDGITYSVDPSNPGAGATVTDYDVAGGPVVTIPDTIDIGGIDYTVTAIGEDGFFDNQLTSVTLPAGLITIGTFAFTGNLLTSVAFPEGLTTISREAFNHNQLTSVNFPDTLTTLENQSFLGNQLTSVTLPDGITEIGTQAFAYNKLSSVTLPDSLTTIRGFAFESNELTFVTLPATLTTIGLGAFVDNDELTRVRFTGPAPTKIPRGDQEYLSFGTADGLTVEFPARYTAASEQEGFTTPEWLGYATVPAYTLSFDTGGGSDVAPVTIWPGETLEMPSTPVRRGYTFTGWYTSPQAVTFFDPALPLTADLTVHAGWERNSSSAGNSSVPGSLGIGSLPGFGS